MIDEDVKIGDDGYRGKVSGQSSFVADSSQRHTQQKAKGAKENMTCSLIHCMLGTLKAKGAPTRLRLTCNNVCGTLNVLYIHTYEVPGFITLSIIIADFFSCFGLVNCRSWYLVYNYTLRCISYQVRNIFISHITSIGIQRKQQMPGTWFLVPGSRCIVPTAVVRIWCLGCLVLSYIPGKRQKHYYPYPSAPKYDEILHI